MKDWDWDEALGALNLGHTLNAIERLRGIAAAVGVTPPLHPVEVREVDRLRRAARAYLADADAIEARAGAASTLTRCAACGAPAELCGHAA